MAARVNFYWRCAITSGCFIAFAISGMVFSLLIFPALCLVGSERRRSYSQWLIHKFFSFIVAVLRFTGCMRLETAGIERLRKAGAVLVIANHPTYIDIVVLLSLIPAANCVVKSDHWDSPVFGGILRAAGWIRSSRADLLLEDCGRALDAGEPIIIFPEGTRSNPGAPVKFMRGAAYIALKSAKPIVPVLLRCEPLFLTKGAPWYLAPTRPFHFRVVVHEALRADALADTRQAPVIAARRLTRALEGYFSQELGIL
jgi:1-acyl-sn-glycerol-3-phosphate acyltransferase